MLSLPSGAQRVNARILVVDDDPQIRRVMRVTLTTQGYEVVDAKTGDEALEQLRHGRTDLVLLDMNMPGMSGLECCRLIRAQSEIAIIMLTVRDCGDRQSCRARCGRGRLRDEAVQHAGAAGAHSRRAAADADHTRSQPNHARRSAKSISMPGRSISGGRTVRLTPKEFDVLRYLSSHPNKTVGHRELLQAVWGPDYGDEVDYLRVVVNQLRKKIEANPGQPVYLLTEPWVGYRLAVLALLTKF